MLGSLDCMHWEWKYCPTAWHKQFVGKEKTLTIVLEAVASYNLSHLFRDLATEKTPVVNYSINDNKYNMRYYLTDGIYPTYGAFVKEICEGTGGVRKDVECAFDVVQAHFAIVSGPSRMWDRDTLHDIMTVCIILHNMIVEKKRKSMEIGHADNSERIADER
ncbi:hypothetical protein PHYBLDRAFT_154142 [Phycomyces blakesleeanus NRRL 1555(-)]|uniref:Uncharacterized protein n=1 Tax=Phycomyces blakesleeanus (strain ATCC 8743b / DSM 1359 / FGSC 10004 / NBRC 33097 / NRRL 1555) TaxID=763407 RepID=A0A163EMC6_PHYB8|nr:hypothetical protein PHYBLDRAFT_154142 [Phycomyces blakesleeanus NRRL 1555(-)]OAD79480.1 hypothetical protein PHYBLDRAFT_154142 [Phycomyces blakesleeanus NRRL 1555(-)]|eukprot:XP_018297520.1 hypothetical protein PHYBLDRAFT_154142 [Phycomyces blakesleeanus NRRL 1555(-)]